MKPMMLTGGSSTIALARLGVVAGADGVDVRQPGGGPGLVPSAPGQLARCYELAASWRAGITPGCGCLTCRILGTAAAELHDALDGV